MHQRFLRSSGTEVAIDAMACKMNMHILPVVDFNYRIEVDTLRKTLERLFEEEPIIGAKYKWTTHGPMWIVESSPIWQIEEYYLDSVIWKATKIACCARPFHIRTTCHYPSSYFIILRWTE